MAQNVVLGAVAAGVSVVVDDDVVVTLGASRCEDGGRGVCWGAVGRLGSECRRF